MDNQITIIALRLIHVLAGIFWVGAVIMIGRFILPSVRALGPSGGPLMRELGQRKLSVFLNVAALLTILSGIAMYWRMMSLSNGAWAHSNTGMTFGAGAVLALLAAIVGNAVSKPTGNRLGKLGEEIVAGGGAPTTTQRSEMEMLQARLIKATTLVAILVVLAAALMAVARYV